MVLSMELIKQRHGGNTKRALAESLRQKEGFQRVGEHNKCVILEANEQTTVGSDSSEAQSVPPNRNVFKLIQIGKSVSLINIARHLAMGSSAPLGPPAKSLRSSEHSKKYSNSIINSTNNSRGPREGSPPKCAEP